MVPTDPFVQPATSECLLERFEGDPLTSTGRRWCRERDCNTDGDDSHREQQVSSSVTPGFVVRAD